MPAGRPNPLANPAFAREVAEAFVGGLSRREMADIFGVKDLDTITRWRRDPRVKAVALKLIEDRILQVTRRVDAVISQRLEKAEDMTVQELVLIRKEFLGGALRAQTERADAETVNEAQGWLEANPDAADQLQKILNGELNHPVVGAAEAQE
jgi:hypothetical protein